MMVLVLNTVYKYHFVYNVTQTFVFVLFVRDVRSAWPAHLLQNNNILTVLFFFENVNIRCQ